MITLSFVDIFHLNSMSNDKNIFQLKQELNIFLKNNPELTTYQKEIDNVLNKAGSNPYNRMNALQSLIDHKLQELKEAIGSLN